MRHHVIYGLFFLCLIFVSCKKESLSSDHWGELRAKKMEEIQLLINSKTATNIDDWYVKEANHYWCGMSYFPMHKSMEQDFNRLWQEYRDLSKNEIDAGIKEGVIYEPCDDNYWYNDSPIRMVLENQHPKLIYLQDISPTEYKEMLPALKDKIDAYKNKLTCTGNEQWSATRIFEGCDESLLLYQRDKDYTEIKKTVGRYNVLKIALSSFEKPDCKFTPSPAVQSITCENGKPTIHLKK
ncbi:MAG: hypothetical protein K0R59_1521 [Sphingobacterium sp.]|nr:hypothetical protein [Sphingobacterium sp.]